MSRIIALMLVALSWLVPETAAQTLTDRAEELEFFERHIRPLFADHCSECHAADAKTIHGSLRLDAAQGIMAGGDSGTLLLAGEPDSSLLIEVLEYDGDIQMPPQGKLPEAAIDLVREWIRRGAALPQESASPIRTGEEIDFEAGRRFWSFQPVTRQPLPNVAAVHWPQSRIDMFLLAAMEREGLRPSPQADRVTLVRRLYFDVIGLPPTPEQVADFVTDDSPDAWPRLVDRLLQSPQHGEKWARPWLDLARYTDTTASWLYQTAQAHFYRDWVVQALNDDMAYDEFVHRQLATDLMESTGPEDLPALGFVSLSPTYWKELKLPCEVINTIVADEYEERVDAVSRTFLGLTVACARCHDHKFDPISTEDFYALAGVFASCRQTERPMIAEELYEPVRKAKAAVTALEETRAELKKKKPEPAEDIAAIEAQIAEIKTQTPLYDTPLANALSEESLYVVRAGATPQDGTKLDYRPGPQDLPLFIRGNPNRHGPVVPRRFLTVLSHSAEPFQHGSGRLELAHAITTDAAPLAARVIVNRIWAAHFGQGIVTTLSDFGRQGERPSHPELLDDLAARFIENGWSLRWLHREILLSAAWQQSSAYDESRTAADPDNRWLSRMNRQRLPFESWRDAMLSVSGVLDPTVGGPSTVLDAAGNHRRTLYGTIDREEPAPTLQMHDVPDATQHAPERLQTTTPLQGLYALNGPLLTEQSQQLVERLFQEVPDGAAERIERAYRLLYARPPSADEARLGLSFVTTSDTAATQSLWMQYIHVLLASNEFLYID